MSADIIVSYDGTANDDDALALGMALSSGGASVALAYVRHSREFDPAREALAQHDADRRLKLGAQILGDGDIPTHVIVSASTDGGLEELAQAQGARMIVFGSDYRTAPGRAEPGNTAQRMLDGGPLAIAVAQAGLRTRIGEPIRIIATAQDETDEAVLRTAASLASKLGAELVRGDGGSGDVIVVGSQPGGRPGMVTLSGSTRAALNAARGSVLVLALGVAVEL